MNAQQNVVTKITALSYNWSWLNNGTVKERKRKKTSLPYEPQPFRTCSVATLLGIRITTNTATLLGIGNGSSQQKWSGLVGSALEQSISAVRRHWNKSQKTPPTVCVGLELLSEAHLLLLYDVFAHFDSKWTAVRPSLCIVQSPEHNQTRMPLIGAYTASMHRVIKKTKLTDYLFTESWTCGWKSR